MANNWAMWLAGLGCFCLYSGGGPAHTQRRTDDQRPAWRMKLVEYTLSKKGLVSCQLICQKRAKMSIRVVVW